VGLGFGFELAFTATPLTQTNFPLFLTQVYLKPLVMLVSPAFLHAAPALTDADVSGEIRIANANPKAIAVEVILINKVYWMLR